MGSLFFVSFFVLLVASFGSSQYCRSGNYGNKSSNKTYNVVPTYKNQAIKETTRSASAISHKFLKEIGRNSSSNVVTSPFLAAMTLTMLAQGAKDHTAASMRDILELPADEWLPLIGYQTLIDAISKYNHAELRLISKIVLPCQTRPKSAFTDRSTAASRSLLTALDFNNPNAASSIINKWCQKETYGQVNDIVKPHYFNAQTSIVLINAAYFRGTWAHPFSSTSMKFHGTNGVKTVPAMRAINTYNYGKIPALFDSEFVEIPFAEYGLSLVVIYPNSTHWGKPDEGLRRVEQHLKESSIKEIIDMGRPTRLEVVLPKIIMRTTADLTGIVKRMNLDVSSGSANLKGIADGPLRVSRYIHHVFMELNEVGPNPALAWGETAAPWNPHEFVSLKAERPFHAQVVVKYNNNPVTLLASRFTGYR